MAVEARQPLTLARTPEEENADECDSGGHSDNRGREPVSHDSTSFTLPLRRRSYRAIASRYTYPSVRSWSIRK
jgi:hypothetical protein